MSLILTLRRYLSPVTRLLGLRGITHKLYRWVLRMRYGADGIGSFRQNGRVWKLHYLIAERGEMQEFETIAWLRNVVKPGDCVLDIGANVGQMTLEAAFLAGPTGRVIAVEPAEGNLKLLRKHVTANGFDDRVAIVPAACAANHGGVLTFHIIGDSAEAVGSGHSIAEPPSQCRGAMKTVEIHVPCVSVDGLCQEWKLEPNVMKIDVEGAEVQVFRGAVQTLQRHRPELQFGFHPQCFDNANAACREIADILGPCGYPTDRLTPTMEEFQLSPTNSERSSR